MQRRDRKRAIRISADTSASAIHRTMAKNAHQHVPVDFVPARVPVVGHVWLAVSHRSVSAVLKDSDRFAMRKRAGGPVAGLAWWMPKTVRVLAHNMLALDDPDHRRLRGLVDGVFARRAVLAMEGQIETHAKGLLQRAVADRGASKRDRTIDLMSAYARPLPMMVICDLLGVPSTEREPFMKDALHLSGIAGVVGFLRALWPLRRLRLRVERLIVDASVRLKAGGKPPGLTDDLVVLQRDGHTLSQDELVAMVFLLLLAGHETTTHAIAGSVMASAVSPECASQNNDLSKVLLNAASPLGIEECLRFVSPVQLSKPRFVLSSGALFDAELEAGDLVMASLACANRDAMQFEQSDRFNLDRKPNPHLEFGAGAHFCLGHQLARLELQVALRVLAQEWPQLAVDADGVAKQPRLGLAVLKTLRVWPDGKPA